MQFGEVRYSSPTSIRPRPHYYLTGPADDDDRALRAAAPTLTRTVYDAVADRGGSISAEHGLGALKRTAAASYTSDVEVDLMRAVKQALDPRGLMERLGIARAPAAQAVAAPPRQAA